MKRILSLFMLFHLAILCHGQMTSEIHVEDAETKKPLKGVTIMIKDSQYGTLTNEEGNTILFTTPEYVLIISFDGYVTQELKAEAKMCVKLVPIKEIKEKETKE